MTLFSGSKSRRGESRTDSFISYIHIRGEAAPEPEKNVTKSAHLNFFAKIMHEKDAMMQKSTYMT